MLNNYQILLASNSPRRRELLAMLDVPFEVIGGLDVDETYPAELPAVEVPEYLARLKASAYRENISPGQLLVTADTVVICDGIILGKPHSLDEAVKMLSMLSGRTHDVITGVCVSSIDKIESFSVTTVVHFDVLNPEEIEYYVRNYCPLDKAGAYGIQEWIGAVGIKRIEGSFYNVMGLPVNRLYRILAKFNDIA